MFDPFMTLSLSLPSRDVRSLRVMFIKRGSKDSDSKSIAEEGDGSTNSSATAAAVAGGGAGGGAGAGRSARVHLPPPRSNSFTKAANRPISLLEVQIGRSATVRQLRQTVAHKARLPLSCVILAAIYHSKVCVKRVCVYVVCPINFTYVGERVCVCCLVRCTSAFRTSELWWM